MAPGPRCPRSHLELHVQQSFFDWGGHKVGSSASATFSSFYASRHFHGAVLFVVLSIQEIGGQGNLGPLQELLSTFPSWHVHSFHLCTYLESTHIWELLCCSTKQRRIKCRWKGLRSPPPSGSRICSVMASLTCRRLAAPHQFRNTFKTC